MGWTIGKHRVEAKVDAMLLSVLIDDEKPKAIASSRLLGDFPIKIGKRDALIRRTRNLDIARSELWIGDTCVPKSPDSLVQKLAPKNTLCAGKHPESFRAPAVPAKYMCASCRALLCGKCVAVDRVRCLACLEEASRADALALRQGRFKGPLIGAAIGLSVALIGVAIREARVVGVGFASIVYLLFKVIQGYVLERREAKQLRARLDRLASRTPEP